MAVFALAPATAHAATRQQRRWRWRMPLHRLRHPDRRRQSVLVDGQTVSCSGGTITVSLKTPAHRRRRHLPRPQRPDPPRRRRAGRTTRRMDRITPLPRPGRPQQIPSRPQPTTRTGGHPGGSDRLTTKSKNHTTTSYTTSLDLHGGGKVTRRCPRWGRLVDAPVGGKSSWACLSGGYAASSVRYR